jgi:hypothetical protein
LCQNALLPQNPPFFRVIGLDCGSSRSEKNDERMTPREQEEYRALRATIRERGSTRAWVFTVGLAAWAGLVTAMVALTLPPAATFVSLVALAATFEAVLALHASVERVGRYLLVFHGDAWERTAGAFGRPRGALVVDPLFSALFLLATVVNLLPLVAASPIVQEVVIIGLAHAAFAARVIVARTLAARQRAVDTARFEELKNNS